MQKMKKIAIALTLMLMLMLISAAPALAHVPFCVEYVNPHGQNIPPAGSTTLPGPNGGENEDGFYKVGTDVGTAVTVIDKGTDNICGTSDDTVFGPFPSGTVIKYTEANGATPSISPMGSNNGGGNGQAGAVAYHITGRGDFCVCSVVSGACVDCLVPPPPK